MADNNQNEQQFRCTGDCLNCRALHDRKIQWQYCASQHAYNAFRMMQTVQETMQAMAGEVKELKEKIAAIQDSEALVFDPHKETKPPVAPVAPATPTTSTTQEGAGVKQ